MGCIDSDKANPVYLVGSYCKRPGWNYPKRMVLVWNMNSYYDWKNCYCWILFHKQSQTKKKKQKTNKIRRKNQNQAYIKVDLDDS